MNAKGCCCCVCNVQPEFVRSRIYIYIFNSASYQTDNLKTVYNIANGFCTWCIEANKSKRGYSVHTHTHTQKHWNLMYDTVRCVAIRNLKQSLWVCVAPFVIDLMCNGQCVYVMKYSFWHCIEQQTFECLNMDVGSLMENRDLLTDRICCNDANARQFNHTFQGAYERLDIWSV